MALKHLQEKFEEPRNVNPLIPQSVENVVLRAMRKNPDERYASARQMLRDLDTCLLPERRNEAKIVFSSEEEEDDERTIIMPAIRGGSFPKSNPGEGGSGDEEWGDGMMGNTELPAKKSRNGRTWIKPVSVVAAVLLFLAGMWYAVAWLKTALEVPEYDVPTVVGMTLDEAIEELKKVRMSPALPVEERPSDTYPAGVVISQEKMGMRAKEGATIALVVSSGPETVVMPDYVGRQWNEAEPELAAFARGQEIAWTERTDRQRRARRHGDRPETGGRRAFQPEGNGDRDHDQQRARHDSDAQSGGEKLSVAEVILEREGFENWKVEREKTYASKDTVFKQWPFQEGEAVDPKDPNLQIILYVSDGLPDDAVETFRSVSVPPVEPGVTTTVRILVTDAFGAKREWKTQDITETTYFTIPLVLSPQTSAVVTVHRNDMFYNSFTTTYQDAINDMNPDRDIDPFFDLESGLTEGDGEAEPAGQPELSEETDEAEQTEDAAEPQLAD